MGQIQSPGAGAGAGPGVGPGGAAEAGVEAREWQYVEKERTMS